MRALMLVLPYSMNNLSAENLEELYTRPPITKIINNDTKKSVNIPAIAPDSISITSTERSTVRPQKSATTYRSRTTATPERKMYPTTFHPKSVISTTSAPSVTTYSPPQTVKKMRKPEKYSSQYNADTSLFLNNNNKGITEQPARRDNVRDILASIGLFPNSLNQSIRKEITTTTTSIRTTIGPTTRAPITKTTVASAEMEKAEITKLLKSFGLLNPDGKSLGLAPLPQIEPEFKPIAVMMKDDTLHVEEFKELPHHLKTEKINKPDIVPADYVAFKPLPIPDDPQPQPKEEINSDMAEFFKTYGLMDNVARNKKSMKDDSALKRLSSDAETDRDGEMINMPEIDKELLTPQMAGILGNIGISMSNLKESTTEAPISNSKLNSRKIRKQPQNHKSADSVEISEKISSSRTDKLVSEGKTSSNIFKPSKKSQSAEDDFRKLEQLLETIKELDKLNANLTKEEILELNLRSLNLSESFLRGGPDPLHNNEFDARKNEVKRQDQEMNSPTKISLNLDDDDGSSTNITTSSTLGSSSIEIISTTNEREGDKILKVDAVDDGDDSSSDDSTTTTTTEEPRNNLSDVDDSFSSGADPVTEEPLPPPRRNGFYFLSDWNSFLEVGEEPNKVVIRYDPKVGDPSRFIPINVP